MPLSTFILALFVFLQSSVLLEWFTVDPKFLGLVGVFFVIVVLVEALLVYSGRPLVFWKKPQ